MRERRGKLLALMRDEGMEAAWLVKPENVRYLTGYGGEGSLLVSDSGSVILTDFRYVEQAERQAPDCPVSQITQTKKTPRLLAELLDQQGIRSLCFEDDAVTVAEYAALSEALKGVALSPSGALTERLRMVKDPEEISCILRAADIACEAFEQLLVWVKAGMTEREIQRRLDDSMLRLGAEAVGFPTIACAGPNGSLPHAVPSERAVQTGELLTLDFGARVDGYVCDMTRTIAIGPISDTLRDVYMTVLEASQAALVALKPGVTGQELDRVAREVIDAKYPGAFGHSLGHGVGLLIHEAPALSARGDTPLAPRHVVTVEPGIYLPGVGGCRIEDTVIVTQTSYVNPITARKDLIVV